MLGGKPVGREAASAASKGIKKKKDALHLERNRRMKIFFAPFEEKRGYLEDDREW